MAKVNAPKNNAELRQLAKDALANWLFDEDTDPDGHIKAGLEYYASEGDVAPDTDIPAMFQGFHKSLDKWDILEERARAIGSQR